MRLPSLIVLFCLISVFCDSQVSHSQEKWWKDKKYKNENTKAKYELCKKTFNDIANSFTYGNVGQISQYISSLVYLDIFGNEKGFYSPTQTEIILANFMDNFAIESFRYRKSSRFSTYASANGVYEYRKGYIRSNFAATVSLKYKDRIWYVEQIVIN